MPGLWNTSPDSFVGHYTAIRPYNGHTIRQRDIVCLDDGGGDHHKCNVCVKETNSSTVLLISMIKRTSAQLLDGWLAGQPVQFAHGTLTQSGLGTEQSNAVIIVYLYRRRDTWLLHNSPLLTETAVSRRLLVWPFLTNVRQYIHDLAYQSTIKMSDQNKIRMGPCHFSKVYHFTNMKNTI